MSEILTACPLDCYDACGIKATVEEGKLIALQGDPKHPITQGVLCGKGYRLLRRHHSPQRVTQPMKRVDGSWTVISWEQALQEIAERIQTAITQYGHHAIMHSYDYGSSGLLKLLTDRFFQMLGGCTDTEGSICWGAGLAAQEYDFGEARSHSPDDIANHARHIVIWGRNVPVTNMHMVPYLKRAKQRGATITVVSATPTDMDAWADLVLYPRPGTDGILALAMCRHLTSTGAADTEFMQRHTDGTETFLQHIEKYTLSYASAACGLSMDDICELTARYADKPTSTLLGIGLQRHHNGGNTIRAIDALAVISGNIGIAGAGVNYANRDILRYVDFASVQQAECPADKRSFARATQASSILAADPPIQVLFIGRTNLVSQLPDMTLTKRALQTIPTRVLVDSFLTETAEFADYFLPSTTVFEEEDVMVTTMWNPYITYAPQAVQPAGAAKPDWEIFRDLARVLGLGDALEIVPGQVIEHALRSVIKTDEDFRHFQRTGHWKLPVEDVAFSNRTFCTPSGKVELYSPRAVADGKAGCASPDDDTISMTTAMYPFHLLTVHPRHQENSQSDEASHVREMPFVEISISAAEEIGVTSNQIVSVTTPQGSIRALVRIHKHLRKDVARMEQGWNGGGTGINVLTTATLADLGIASAQYSLVCNIHV